MKHHTADQLLILGMALTTDKKAMERRVRGVFARKTSAKGIVALSLVLAMMLGIGAFTTACQPGESAQTLTPIPVEQDLKESAEASTAPENTPLPEELAFADMPWKTEQDLIGPLAQVPFVYPISAAHIDEAKTEFGSGLSLTVNAEITIPQAEGYGVRQCGRDEFSIEEYQTLIDYFLPNAKWVPNQTDPGFQTNGAYDLSKADFSNRTTFSVEQNGEMFSVSMGADQHMFFFERAGGIVYREEYLVGDVEMEQQFGDVIREPIALTREAAQSQADQVLTDLNIRDWQLDGAERACMLESGNTDNVLSRGWAFIYVLSNAGLPVHEYRSSGWKPIDQLAYWKVDEGSFMIYVDDQGVSALYWYKRYKPESATYSSVDIIGVDEALTLAKVRIARIYDWGVNSPIREIEIYAIRLSSMLIAYSDEIGDTPYQDDQYDRVYMIPTWDVSCRITRVYGSVEYTTLPFCATDGGAITEQH